MRSMPWAKKFPCLGAILHGPGLVPMALALEKEKSSYSEIQIPASGLEFRSRSQVAMGMATSWAEDGGQKKAKLVRQALSCQGHCGG